MTALGRSTAEAQLRMLQMPPRVSRRSAYRTAELPIQHHTGFIPWRGYAHHHHRCSSHTYNPFNPTAPPSWALAIFRPLWVSSSYYWQGRINQTQYLQTHNSFCISSVAPDLCYPRPGPWSHRSSFLTIRKLLFLGQWHIRCICCLSNIWALIRSTSYTNCIWGSFMRSSGGLDGCHICRV